METRDVVGWEGEYAVTDTGRVMSFKHKRPRELKLRQHNKGYLAVCLSSGARREYKLVHRLVLEAFVGPQPPGYETRHLDGNKHNNNKDNLRWGTSSENNMDIVLHGRHYSLYRGVTHCIHGHEFTDENTLRNSSGGRKCQECNRNQARDYQRRKRAMRNG